jgi:nucleotide-binding universal stress UspA family protein
MPNRGAGGKRRESRTRVIEPKNIVVATDFGSAASRALQYGVEFAKSFGARLHIVHVSDDIAARAVPAIGLPPIDLGRAQESIDQEARRTLGTLVTTEDMRTIDVRPVVLRDMEPGRALLAYARQIEADLIVIGTHGQGGLAEFFLGSAAQRVVRSAPCPVLTVRADERDFVKADLPPGPRPAGSKPRPRIH